MRFWGEMILLVLAVTFWKLALVILAAIIIAALVSILLLPDKKCLHEYRMIKDPETREPYLICKHCGEREIQ